MALLVLLGGFGLLAAAGIVYQRRGSARDARHHPAPGRLMDIGGCRLHARQAGAGRPVVIFESGIAASSISWGLVQPDVALVTATCSYDRAGLAWSDPIAAPRTLEHLVDELARLLRTLSLEPPYLLVAHSFGTFVARAYAAAHPSEVRGLVLVDPIATGEWIDMTAADRRRLRGGIVLSRVGAVLAAFGVVRFSLARLAGGRTSVPRGVARAFGGTTLQVLSGIVREVRKLPADVWPPILAFWCRPRSFVALAAYLSALPGAAAALAAMAEPEDVPIVVLSAGTSTPERLRAHAALAARSKHGRHLIADRGGHWLQLDDPDLVVDAIRGLLTQG